MQAVILAAGKSTRTYPLTLEKPKPLLKIANKTILGHNLEQLEGLAQEVILVVGFKKERIEEFISQNKDNYSFNIKLVEQKEQMGTGHALLQAEPHIKDRFIVFVGDDLFNGKDIKRCLDYDCSILIGSRKDVTRFGVIEMEGNSLKAIQEKPETPASNFVNTGLFVLNKGIFDIKARKSDRGEIEITDMVTKLAEKEKIHCVPVKEYWLPVGYPRDILEANKALLSRKGQVINEGSDIGKDVRIEGPVSLLADSNTSIHAGCLIRKYTSIGNACVIEENAKIENSIIMDNVHISKNSVIENSIIGNRVRIGEGTVISSNGSLGGIIGDNAETSEKTVINPGIKIFPNKKTSPGQEVREDII